MTGEVEFNTALGAYDNHICTACHNVGRVLKLKLPATLFYDGKRLATKYYEYWLCSECREKLLHALQEGNTDGL